MRNTHPILLAQYIKLNKINLKTMTKLRRVYDLCDKKALSDKIDSIDKSSDNTIGLTAVSPDENHKSALHAVLKEACSSLKGGGIIAVPTDTIYGIAGLAQNSVAVRQIYNIKKRVGRNPLAICASNVEQVYRWGNVTVCKELLQKLLPGPVTVVFERTLQLNPELNPGTSLVGIRVPDHIFVRELATLCDEPLALTSANISSEPSCLSVQEFEHLWPQLDLVLDGGMIGSSKIARQGSTVVDLSTPKKFTIIRPGSAMDKTKEVLQSYGLEELSKS